NWHAYLSSNAVLAQPFNPRVGGLAPELLRQRLFQLWVGWVDAFTTLHLPQPRSITRGQGQEKPAVPRLIEAIQWTRAQRQVTTWLIGNAAGVAQHIRRLLIRCGLAQRRVDVLSIATPQTVIHGQSDGERRERSRADVDQVVRAEHRGRILALHDARHGLALAFPATTVPPRPELAVAADRTVHGVRLARLDFAVANAEAIGGAWREVLDHDVSLIHQL